MFNLKKQSSDDKAVVIRQRGANIPLEQLKAAFGESVIVIDSDSHVPNGLQYIGTFSTPNGDSK
jgi:hypothetical protein